MPDFRFVAGTHTYTLDGAVAPSITQVIEAAGLVDLSHMSGDDRQFYAERGTAVHLACHYSDVGTLDESTVETPILGRLEAWREFRRVLAFTVLESERPRYDMVYRYAGTPDRIVSFSDGRRGVIEIKTGPIQEAVAVQLAAQARLAAMDHRPGYPSVAADYRRIAVWLKADGYSMREFHRGDYATDISVFLSALTIYKWKQENMK